MRPPARRCRRAGAGSPKWRKSPPPWPPPASPPASTRPPPPSTPASPTPTPSHPPASPRSPQSSTPCWPSTPPPNRRRPAGPVHGRRVPGKAFSRPGTHVRPAARTSARASAPRQAFRQIGLERIDSHPVLVHGVAFPDGHRLVVQRLEVHRDAVRGADLVLAAVAAADRARVVEVDVPALAQLGGQVAGLG